MQIVESELRSRGMVQLKWARHRQTGHRRERSEVQAFKFTVLFHFFAFNAADIKVLKSILKKLCMLDSCWKCNFPMNLHFLAPIGAFV